MSKIAKLFTALLGIAAGQEFVARSSCWVCGRALTSAASVAAGVGPVCANGSIIKRDDMTLSLFEEVAP